MILERSQPPQPGYKRVFEEYTQALYQRYPDIRIEGENYLPLPVYRYVASFLSIFKLLVIGVIVVGKDPFALFGMPTPGLWLWSQENKVYACMMVFFFSNMIENQCMSTGAFEITLNDVPVWSKLESGHLPSMQQLDSSIFEVGLSYGCEATFMKVCAESSGSTSAGRMSRSLLATPPGDARLQIPAWGPRQQQWPFVTTEAHMLCNNHSVQD
ncbi:hypothetical protein SRHO_G00017480 [Serrasalmus rhombeus]